MNFDFLFVANLRQAYDAQMDMIPRLSILQHTTSFSHILFGNNEHLHFSCLDIPSCKYRKATQANYLRL